MNLKRKHKQEYFREGDIMIMLDIKEKRNKIITRVWGVLAGHLRCFFLFCFRFGS